LGVVDGLAFGAESPLALLQCAADSAKRSDVQELLHAYVQKGHSYAAALSHAIAQSSGINEAFLKQPNNILALEYLRALNCCVTSIYPFAVARIGAAYHDEELHDTYASASSIRREIQTAAPRRNLLAKVLPANSMEALFEAHTEEAIPEINLLFRPLLAQLEHYTLEDLQEIYGINEGFENRLLRAASHCRTMKELLDECHSRRHPQSRIQRLIFHIMLHLRRQDIHEFDKNGPLAGLMTVTGEEDLMIITNTGVIIRTSVANISQTGRSTMGVKVMRLDQNAQIVTFTSVEADDKEDVAEEENES